MSDKVKVFVWSDKVDLKSYFEVNIFIASNNLCKIVLDSLSKISQKVCVRCTVVKWKSIFVYLITVYKDFNTKSRHLARDGIAYFEHFSIKNFLWSLPYSLYSSVRTTHIRKSNEKGKLKFNRISILSL